jgi:predicted dehydrogenase
MRLRVGIIGLGVGERHILGFESNPECEVVSLCDTDSEKLRVVGARYPGKKLTEDPDVLLSDPMIDIISVASYDSAHHYQVLRALQSGKHVFVEKPLCLFEHELREIVATLIKSNTLCLSSNLILRKEPRFEELCKNIKENKLGDIYLWEGDYNYGRVEKLLSGWRGEIPYYSVVHGGAIHLIDLVLWLSQKRVSSVVARGNQVVTGGSKFARDDLVISLLELEDGSIAKITANFGCVAPHKHKLSVYGTKGTFEQGATGDAVYFFDRDPKVEPTSVGTRYPGSNKEDLIPHFVESILGNPDYGGVTAQEVVDVMAVSLAIEKALESGNDERVNYFDL